MMKGISTKLIILLIIAVLTPLSLYGILSVGTSRYYHFRAVTEGNINVAKRAAEEIDLYVTNSMAILHALAQNLGRFNIPRHEEELILSNYVLNFPQFQHITVTDREGKEVISTHNRLPEEKGENIAYQTAVKGEVYKSDVSISKNLTPFMTIAIPIKRLNTIEGAIIADINLMAMWNLVDAIRIGGRSYAYVVSGNGRLIAHGLGEGKVRVLSNENMKSVDVVKRIIAGKLATGIYKNTEGEEVIGVAAPIPSLGWGIVIEEPLKEAYAPARQMTILLTVLIILFVAAASVTGYAGGKRYILGPVNALIGATKKIATGNLDEKVALSTGDEFEEVGDAFNRMMEHLKILQEDIKRNERIAFMNKIAAGLVHDLRHPIRNIENSSRLMLKKYNDEDCRNAFNNIVTREFNNVNHFLDGLLDLARPVRITPVPLDLCVEITGIVEMFKDAAEKKKITIETISPDGPVMANADKFSIERVFKNIIQNAIEAMTSGGTIRVSVASFHDSVLIEFRDTGPGIPEDKIENLFTEFTTTKRSGLGLGLVTSKRIIDAHRGAITVESEVGKGTAFIIRLPAQAS